MSKCSFVLFITLSLFFLSYDNALARKGDCAMNPLIVMGCNNKSCEQACMEKYKKYDNGGCMDQNPDDCCCDFVIWN
ncbi:hypothetical protein RND81_06G092200 [Saponaria officinalis]|uniref:Uncharacterized protein n=1 Tax=Saponaria officinalis TaxID=3572 RepID=A0AAW1K7V3_SAPOF